VEDIEMVVIIFGVSGVGKTTVGKLLATDLGWKFLEADDFHSAENITKMRDGQPLTDEDRRPWLKRLRELIEQSVAANENAVLACSALKKKYRDELRVNADVKFVFLHGSHDRIASQLKNRRGHFFNPTLLDAQFADLEEPKSTDDAVTIELTGEPRDTVKKIETVLRR
jgi:gluconokinase